MITLEFLRSFRIFNLAIFDLVLSYLGIYLLSPLLIKFFEKIQLRTSKAQWLWLTLPLSVVIHSLVGQQTALTKMMFDPHGYYLAKAIILGMIFMTFKKSRAET